MQLNGGRLMTEGKTAAHCTTLAFAPQQILRLGELESRVKQASVLAPRRLDDERVSKARNSLVHRSHCLNGHAQDGALQGACPLNIDEAGGCIGISKRHVISINYKAQHQ